MRQANIIIAFVLTIFTYVSTKYFAQNNNRMIATVDTTQYGWKETFVDEFETREISISKGISPSCFDLPAQCLLNYWSQKECKSQYQSQLRNLNKCNWRVYDMYNWMDFNAPEGQGINAFNPTQVEVKNGRLYLYASRSPISKENLNCKNNFYDNEIGWDNFKKDCPIYSGAIMSQSHENNGHKMGFAQEYGRFEVYAILPDGPGSWPAHWLLPDKELETNSSGGTCGWPLSGEIDIMEMWSDDEGRQYKGGVISGNCEQNIATFGGGHGKSKTMTSQFHKYIVEWTPQYVRFIFDQDVIFSAYQDEMMKSKYHQNDGTNYTADQLDDRFKNPFNVPKSPFFWILNTSIERGKGKREKYRPDIDNFSKTEHIIDYVKVYSRCTVADDPKKCIKFKDHDTVYNYNTNKNETASMEINTFPNPQLKGKIVTTRITSHQFCKKVDFTLVNMAGQIVGVDKVTGGGRGYLYQGPMEENETREIEFLTDNLAAGMYLVTAWFYECGADASGKGNHVFKLIIL